MDRSRSNEPKRSPRWLCFNLPSIEQDVPMSSDNRSSAVAQVFSGLDVDDAREVWESALCAEVDPELFFPEKGQPATAAKAVCAACPVEALCLTTFGPLVTHGVLGGQSADERTHIRRSGRRDGVRRAA